MATIAGDIDAPPPTRTRLVHRHGLVTRVTHWINAFAVTVLLMAWLQIFNAHPRLYWGEYGSTHDTPILMTQGEAGRGELIVGGVAFDTTGLLGWSGGQERGFPAWATLPSFQDLSLGRNLHLFFAWLLIINGIVYWLFGLANRHVARDLAPTRADLAPRAIWRDIVTHAKLKFPQGLASLHYHPLQKLSYFGVVAILIPGIIATGLCMSPGAGAVAPWIVDLFGGRQSARTLHFVFAFALVAFIIVHVLMVVLAGPWNEIRSMVSGKWRITEEAR